MNATTPLYWNDTGRYQKAAAELEKMIPVTGSVDRPRSNPRLERFRKAVNCYYDLYNNGLCNRRSEFRRVFDIAPSQYRIWRSGDYTPAFFAAVEGKMDEIIRDAAEEQGFGGLIREVDLADMDRRVSELTEALRAAHNGLDMAQAAMAEGRDRDFVVQAFDKTRAALAAC